MTRPQSRDNQAGILVSPKNKRAKFTAKFVKNKRVHLPFNKEIQQPDYILHNRFGTVSKMQTEKTAAHPPTELTLITEDKNRKNKFYKRAELTQNHHLGLRDHVTHDILQKQIADHGRTFQEQRPFVSEAGNEYKVSKHDKESILKQYLDGTCASALKEENKKVDTRVNWDFNCNDQI